MPGARCHAGPERWDGGEVRLGPEETRHLRAVLRMVPGDAVAVFDGAGRSADAVIAGWDGEAARLRIRTIHAPESGTDLRLCAALLKPAAMDWVVQKSVELGASELAPVLAARSEAVPRGAKADKRRARWERIAVQAAKQCGIARLPTIRPPASMDEILAEPGPRDLHASLRPEARPLWAVARDGGFDRGPVRVWVGPEGDWTDGEEMRLREAGSAPVRLGPRVLRAETAALYVLSVLGAAREIVAHPESDA
jgi:16S rRNA (uracil1498-N3)-methyltransferase